MRTCPDCGYKMKEVAKLKGGYNRRKMHRFKCTNPDCGLESSTSQTEWEEQESERLLKEAEYRNRGRNDYGNQN